MATLTGLYRRQIFLAGASCLLAAGNTASWAAGAVLPAPLSLADELARALDKGLPLVLMVSLEGCPFCRVARDSYLDPLRRQEGVPVFQIDMRSAVSVRDFRRTAVTHVLQKPARMEEGLQHNRRRQCAERHLEPIAHVPFTLCADRHIQGDHQLLDSRFSRSFDERVGNGAVTGRVNLAPDIVGRYFDRVLECAVCGHRHHERNVCSLRRLGEHQITVMAKHAERTGRSDAERTVIVTAKQRGRLLALGNIEHVARHQAMA